MAKHIVALPVPAKDAKLAVSLRALRGPQTPGRWLAVHALYADCRCSLRVVDHLVTTARPSEWDEMVLWVGQTPPSHALEERFDVRRVAVSELAALGIEAAPLLIALDPAGQVRYVGGYTDRKQGPAIEDLRILRSVRDAGSVASLPAFGCAVSDGLKRSLAGFSGALGQL